MLKYYLLYSIVVVIISSACKKENTEEIDCKYASGITPIINANCLTSGCHNTGSLNGDFTTYTGLKKVASSGALENRVIINQTMPPSKPLSDEDRKKIKCWIDSGSPNN